MSPKKKAPTQREQYQLAASQENSRRQSETVAAILEASPDGQCTEAEWAAAYRLTAT